MLSILVHIAAIRFAICDAIAILASGTLLVQHRVQVGLLCVFCVPRRRRGEDGAEVSAGRRRRGSGSGSGGGGGGGGRLLLGLHVDSFPPASPASGDGPRLSRGMGWEP